MSRLASTSIRLGVHSVNAVAFTTTDFRVTRHKFSSHALVTPGVPKLSVDLSDLL
ncbi:hypothetical protein HDF11_003387 [Tunturiibacter psychrotolerans]